MFERLPHDGPLRHAFQRSLVGRLTGPLGCLFVIVACPIGLAIGAVALLLSALGIGRSGRFVAVARAAGPVGGPAPGPAATSREAALARLVEALAMDETFTVEDARQAGTLAAGGMTVDELLAEARERRWIEVRGDRLAVTAQGRAEADRLLRRSMPE